MSEMIIRFLTQDSENKRTHMHELTAWTLHVCGNISCESRSSWLFFLLSGPLLPLCRDMPLFEADGRVSVVRLGSSWGSLNHRGYPPQPSSANSPEVKYIVLLFWCVCCSMFLSRSSFVVFDRDQHAFRLRWFVEWLFSWNYITKAIYARVLLCLFQSWIPRTNVKTCRWAVMYFYLLWTPILKFFWVTVFTPDEMLHFTVNTEMQRNKQSRQAEDVAHSGSKSFDSDGEIQEVWRWNTVCFMTETKERTSSQPRFRSLDTAETVWCLEELKILDNSLQHRLHAVTPQ